MAFIYIYIYIKVKIYWTIKKIMPPCTQAVCYSSYTMACSNPPPKKKKKSTFKGGKAPYSILDLNEDCTEMEK